MTTTCSLLDRINELPDPRQASKCSHILGEVIFMTLCGILCDADDWNAIIKGCLVTADAMSCQKKIAKQITTQEADYLLAVKNNQKTLYNAIDRYFMTYWTDHPEDLPDDAGFSEQANETCWMLPLMKISQEQDGVLLRKTWQQPARLH